MFDLYVDILFDLLFGISVYRLMHHLSYRLADHPQYKYYPTLLPLIMNTIVLLSIVLVLTVLSANPIVFLFPNVAWFLLLSYVLFCFDMLILPYFPQLCLILILSIFFCSLLLNFAPASPDHIARLQICAKMSSFQCTSIPFLTTRLQNRCGTTETRRFVRIKRLSLGIKKICSDM